MRLIRTVLFGLLVIVTVATPVGASRSSLGDRDMRSHRELRYVRVVGQTNWVTCGPAAVATLLTHYFGINASEDDVLRAISGADAFNREQTPEVPIKLDGYSMLDLKRALSLFDVESAGYRVSEGALKAYFDQGGLPVIIHLTEPQQHFAVLVGYAGDLLIMGDPSFGERTVSRYELNRRFGFSETVLIPIPTIEQLELVREQQNQAVRDLIGRQARLRRLGESM